MSVPCDDADKVQNIVGKDGGSLNGALVYIFHAALRSEQQVWPFTHQVHVESTRTIKPYSIGGHVFNLNLAAKIYESRFVCRSTKPMLCIRRHLTIHENSIPFQASFGACSSETFWCQSAVNLVVK